MAMDTLAKTPSTNGVPVSRRFFRRIKSLILRNETIYKASLQCRFGRAHSEQLPRLAALPNQVLQHSHECGEATRMGISLGLPLHRTPDKNWDHLAAVYAIAGSTSRTARILDAGAELYSNVLPALYSCGYRELFGMNLAYTSPARRGPIRYLPGDITRTGFADGFFDAITCMSVIEHGVPLEDYFKEIFRVLKPGGLLITSTDYYPEPIDTRGQSAWGAPIKIFSKDELQKILDLALATGFTMGGEINLECAGKPIRWAQYDLDYTFVIFTLQKPR